MWGRMREVGVDRVREKKEGGRGGKSEGKKRGRRGQVGDEANAV